MSSWPPGWHLCCCPLTRWVQQLPRQALTTCLLTCRYWVTELDGDLVVSLPGTTHPMDWSSNMSVHYVPIDGSHPPADTPTEQLEKVPCAHAGFYFRAETIPTLALLEQAAAKGLRLVLTGHSLGAAVANICTLTALTAQKKAREAAANAAVAKHTAAAAAAAVARHSSSSSGGGGGAAKQKRKKPNPFRTASTAAVVAAAEAHINHSWCSANSDITVSPQAALVDVVCVAFASPHWANQALADHIEENDWGEVFVNVVVPGENGRQGGLILGSTAATGRGEKRAVAASGPGPDAVPIGPRVPPWSKPVPKQCRRSGPSCRLTCMQQELTLAVFSSCLCLCVCMCLPSSRGLLPQPVQQCADLSQHSRALHTQQDQQQG